MIGAEEIKTRFTYHAPDGDQIAKYGQIRQAAFDFAMMLDELVPDSREKSLALTHLEESVMQANAAILRRSE